MTRADAPRTTIHFGEVLAGKYRVERVLGQGGMGTVVLARHIQLDENVAIKFLLPHALGNPEAVARFVREARAAVKIKSEHVARVSDVGTLDDGAPYMVMEYLEGGDLAAWLAQRGPLPIEQAVDFVLQACVAVADAHVLGIVHRDLKPANLFCVRRSDGHLTIKVLDFGISKLTDSSGPEPVATMTRTGGTMGSPLYMSPEQMQSAKRVDRRTDIWALGVVLFELISGRAPFAGESLLDLAVKIATEPPASLRTLRPEVSPELEAVVRKCLEKDPVRRYASVGEFAVALLPFAPNHAKGLVQRISGIIQSSGQSWTALDRVPEAHSTQVPKATLDPVGRTTLAPAPRRPTALWTGFALLAAFVFAGGALAFYETLKGASSAMKNEAEAAARTALDSGGASPLGVPDAASAGTPATADLPSLAPTEVPDRGSVPVAASTNAVPAEPPPMVRRAASSSLPSAPAAPHLMGPAATGGTSKPPATNCSIVTDYDSEGQPHFKKVCK